ncbi:MAG: serine protease [Oligoflexales bacterium]
MKIPKFLLVGFVLFQQETGLAREGMFAPHQVATPFAKAAVLESVVRARPLIRFEVHVFETAGEAQAYRDFPENGKKKFLAKGGSVWPVIITRAEMEKECRSPAALQPGTIEVCTTYSLQCTSYPCHTNTPDFIADTATGFFVSGEGHILTNYHVARECIERLGRENGSTKEEDCPDIEISVPTLIGDSENPLYKPVKTVKILKNVSSKQWKEGADFALLKIDYKPASYLHLSAKEVHNGQRLWGFGFPARTRRSSRDLRQFRYSDADNSLRIAEGIVIDSSFANYLHADIDGVHGNSGSPVLDESGAVVGIFQNLTVDLGQSRSVQYAGKAIIGKITRAMAILSNDGKGGPSQTPINGNGSKTCRVAKAAAGL